jgi:hypothetical protein
MPCTPAEVVALAAFVALVLVGGYSTWVLSGLLKDIELRHPAVHKRLGSPSMPGTSNSDSHTVTVIRFLLKNEHAALHDSKLEQPVRHLKMALLLSTLLFVTLLGAITLVPSVRELATLSCLAVK